MANVRPVAELVSLEEGRIPTMRDIERHRRQQLVFGGCVLVGLAALLAVVISNERAPGLTWPFPYLIQIGLLVLVILFSLSAIQKEARLSRLTRLIIEEHELSAGLSARVRELNGLLTATRTMNVVLDMREVLEAILGSALELLRARSGSVMLVRGEDELATIVTAGETAARGARVRFGQGIAGRVAVSRQPLLIHGELSEQDRGVCYAPGTEAPASAMCVPLLRGEELLGVLNVNSQAGRAFNQHELRALCSFATDAGIAIGNAHVYEKQRLLSSRAMHQALHDPLTTLPNRALLLDRIEHALLGRMRNERHVGLLFLDIDDFKRINEALGHLAGDHVLRAVGARLRSCLRVSDTVARFGGDEFAVVLDGIDDALEADATARRMLRALEAPVEVGGREIRFCASIGIALAGRSATPSSLLRDADAAMHVAKRTGKNAVAVFDPAMISSANRMLDLEEGIYAALERDELTLHYQPICDLRDESRVACEALLRWRHPSHGVVPASEFLLAVQHAGLLPRVDVWSLRRACTEMRAAELLLHVNVAAETLHAVDIAREVEAACMDTGFPPRRLVLELTETSLIGAPERAARQFAHLKTLGVHLALDDFGTGYSTFSYLQSFPVDEVKIDRAFVSELDSSFERSRLVASIVRFAENLGIEVVAEGVEREAQQAALIESGCRLGQGYRFGRAVPAEELFAALPHREAAQSTALLSNALS